MGFLENYLDFTSSQEATERVHRWVALSTIAGALERKVWLPRGTYTLFPNLYTFIIGPSGVVRKSTSTAIGVDLLRDIDTVKVMSERLTASSLIQQFSRSGKTFTYNGREIKQSASFAYASELNVFLGEVFGSISELLTTFYDCIPNDSAKPWTYETISSGITRVYGPCLNLLGASTPTWLIRSIPPSEMEGGFASRVIFVVEDSARRAIAWPELETKPDDYESKKRFLASDLRRIHSLIGPMKCSPQLIHDGELWYKSHQRANKANFDQRFSGYFGRKFDTVLKVAMLLSVSESSSLEINHNHFEHSLSLLTDVERRMFDAFGAHGENPNSILLEKLWRVIASEPRMSFALIMKQLRRDASSERVLSVIEDLRAMRRVIKVTDDVIGDIYFKAVDPEKPL